MLRSRPIGRFLDFCRGDYPPAGVPNTGFVPLIALLRRRLTDGELTTVVRWCCAAGPPILPADIGVAIERLLQESAADSDTARVTDHLARDGWLLGDADGELLPCAEFDALTDVCAEALGIPGVDAVTITLRRDGRRHLLTGAGDVDPEMPVRQCLSYTLRRCDAATASMTFSGTGAGRWDADLERRAAALARRAAAIVAASPWGAAMAGR